MRLICPNCDAQYEVEDAVIPDEGRDVQCSNCGTTWFQDSAKTLRETARADSLAEHDDDDDDDDDDISEAATAQEPAAKGDDVAEEPVAAAEAAVQKRPDIRRRTLDDAVLNVLREEAARENRARGTEGHNIETQGDLGLLTTRARPKAGQSDANADVDDEEEDEDDLDLPEDKLVSPTARRELLPDIEEINSTLRATSERRHEAAARDAPETQRQRRYGFRRGFLASLMVMVLLLLPYILSEEFSARFPAAAPVIMRYSAGIDSLRIWMDDRMKSTTESMRGTSAE
ncbi:MAG: zinc-ribbon domain-containing protein [Albidovulum sp.]